MAEDEVDFEVKMEQITLGTLILKFNMPMPLVDQINEICDASKVIPFNSQLAGKINDEFSITSALSDDHKSIFLTFFALLFSTVLPRLTWPSPATIV